MLKRLSIRQKQMAIVMATSSVALLLACGAFVIYEVISFRDAMTENLSSLASIIGNNCTAALSYNDARTAREVLNTLEKEPHIVAACVYDKEGFIFQSYVRDQKRFVFPAAARTDSHQFLDKRLSVFRRIDLKGDRLRTVYV